jgi:hypothetical protein
MPQQPTRYGSFIPFGLAFLVTFGSFRASGAEAPVALATAVDHALQDARTLPPFTGTVAQPVAVDWLVTPVKRRAGAYRGTSDREIVLDNGLIRRTFRLAPNGATVGFDNLMTGASVIRGVKPEADVSLDGQEFNVGGLTGQPEYGYLLPEWIDGLKSYPASFRCVGFGVGKTQARFSWKRKRHGADLPWPPPGISLTFHYQAPGEAHRAISSRTSFTCGARMDATWTACCMSISGRAGAASRCSTTRSTMWFGSRWNCRFIIPA